MSIKRSSEYTVDLALENVLHSRLGKFNSISGRQRTTKMLKLVVHKYL